MTDDLDDMFCQVRSYLNSSALSYDVCDAVWALAQAASRQDSVAFQEVWVPYIQGYAHRFVSGLTTLYSRGELERACQLIPGVRWGLSLNDEPLSDLDVLVLMDLPIMGAVAELDLDDNRLHDDGAAVLASADVLSSLGCLSLMDNLIGGGGACALFRSTSLSGLFELDLNGNRIQGGDLLGLPPESGLTSLVRLNLGANKIDDQGVDALTACTFPDLVSLDLSHNCIGDDGAKVLANTPQLERLERLVLDGNPIGQRGWEALLGSPYLNAGVRESLASL